MRRFVALALLTALLPIPRDLHAGAWTLPAGHFWTKLAFLKQATDEEYGRFYSCSGRPSRTNVSACGDEANKNRNMG